MKKIVWLLMILMGNHVLYAGDFSALTRDGEVKLRIASYNVYYSSCFPADDGGPSGNSTNRVENFARIVNAMDADILALQEVFHAKPYFLLKTPEGILAHMESITGEIWHMAHDYEFDSETDPGDGSTGKGGRFIFSRYPIIWQDYFNNRITAALIDLPVSVSDKDVLVVNVHYSSQSQADATGAFIADVVAGKKEPQVPRDVMIMVCGDFNGQPEKARYNAVYDSISDFSDLKMTHLGWSVPNTTTIGSVSFDDHRNPVDVYNKILDTGEIQQKRIDYMFWRSNRLETKHAYILNPLIMDRAALNTYGLHQIDTALNPEAGLKTATRCDHWPYFADFVDPGDDVIGK